MKNLFYRLFLVFVLFVGINIHAQCPDPVNHPQYFENSFGTWEMRFHNQNLINQFGIDFPNCTEITYITRIMGQEISSLMPFQNITSIHHLFIQETLVPNWHPNYNTRLQTLQGLNNLTNVNVNFEIDETSLISLDGLQNLQTIGNGLVIDYNVYLTTLTHLSNLTSVGNIFLQANHILTSLDGLEGIESLGSFNIINHFELNTLHGLHNLKSLESYSGHNQFYHLPKLTSMTGLESLERVEGILIINSNDGLLSLDGLGNLEESRGLRIYNNDVLQNINALSGLTSIKDELQIVNNPILITLEPLQNMSIQGGGMPIDGGNSESYNNIFITGNSSLTNLDGLQGTTNLTGQNDGIVIRDNANLTSLYGLHNLTGVTDIEIRNNPSLTSLEGLEGLTKTFHIDLRNNGLLTLDGLNDNLIIQKIPANSSSLPYVRIENNSDLTFCSKRPICVFLSNEAGNHLIQNNENGCNSKEQILDNCSLCPSGNVILSSQQDVNNFLLTYPDCTEIDGDLIIGFFDGMTNITDLSPLENIVNITGSLIIMNNPLLVTFDGLNALETVGGNLSIGAGNDFLSDITALSNLGSINGYLQISNNPSLESLDGLENIDPDSIGDLGLLIVGNGNLIFCNLPNICSYLSEDSVTHPRNISGNSTGCASVVGIQAVCSGITCPVGNLSFNGAGGQANLNLFILDYPNCTTINGHLTISGNTITDLSPLQNITNITGDLTMNTCVNLLTLEPLENLESLGGAIFLSGLTNLPNLNGLHNMASIRGISISFNPGLTDLQGLEGLTDIENEFLYLANNNSLVSLNGLQNVDMNTVSHLYIQNHPNLSLCYNLPNICEYLYNGGAASISGNTGDCLNRNAIQNACPTIWFGDEWNIGEPDQNRNAIIEGDLITNNDLTTKNFTVNSGVFTLAPNTTLTVNGKITNNADAENFLVQSGANLIQKEYTANDNVGEITVQRESGEMIRLDYTLWSSPVIGQNLFGFSPNTVNGVTNYIGSAGRIYIYDGSNGYVNPDPYTAESVMENGVGYLFRSPNNFHSSIPVTYMGEFKGIPFNGSISVSTHPLSYTSVGNPYPSNIDTDDFILANPGIATLYFWNNASDSGNNYATCALGNCVASGSGTPEPNGIISAGQGFIVATFDNSVSFDNSMRVDNSALFFKTDVLENNRIRLNLSDDYNTHNQVLISYMEGATNNIDHQMDGKLFSYEGSALYNLIDDEKYVIQGRQLPFETSDVVPLGFRAEESGKFKISLVDFDGLFADGNTIIYLKDKQLNLVHNLMESDYSFESNLGEFNERFEVVYGGESVMGTSDLTSNSIHIYKHEGKIVVDSPSEKILSVKIYDLHGRIIHTNEAVNAIRYEAHLASKGVLVVKAETQNGEVYTKKVIN